MKMLGEDRMETREKGDAEKTKIGRRQRANR